jgi:mono/diheme cytochrome c family protein
MMRRTLVAIGLFACAAPAILTGQREGGDGPGAAPQIKVVTRDYDMKALLQTYEAPLSDEVRKGRNVWLQRCAYCHDGVGTPTYNTLGPWLDKEVVAKRGDSAVREKILKGSSTMPAFQWGLKPAQVDQVIAFIKTISPDQKPTEAQKSGKMVHSADL